VSDFPDLKISFDSCDFHLMTEFKTDIRVSWVDTDAAGLVHFSNYFRFFERAEESLLGQIELNYSLLRSRYGIGIPKVEAHCKYLAALHHEDVIQIKVAVRDIEEKTFREDFHLIGTAKDNLVAEGYVVSIAMSFETGRSVPIPPEVASKLKSFMKS
jgi:acyl-CoA thioester hydrolase